MAKRKRNKRNHGAQEKTFKGKTSTGFVFEITQERLDNYELLEAVAEVDKNPAALPTVINLMLGDKAQDLKDHVRTETGMVPTGKLMQEVEEIFKSRTHLKK
jgi:hypothetical protein